MHWLCHVFNEMASSVDPINLFMFGTQNKVNSNLVDSCTESVAVFANVRVNSSQVVKCFSDDTMSSQRSSGLKHTEKNCVPLKNHNKRSRAGLKKTNIEVASSKQKARKETCRVDTVPGTSLKVCSCGTIAGTARSKKCRSCHKFFYDHWRKIPHCPKCNFICKANHQEEFPLACLRCGFELISDLEIEEKPIGSSSLDTQLVNHNSISEPPKLVPTVLNIFKLCDNQPEKNNESGDSCKISDSPFFAEVGTKQPSEHVQEKLLVSEDNREEEGVKNEEDTESLKSLDSNSLENVSPHNSTSNLAPSLPSYNVMLLPTLTQAITRSSPPSVVDSGTLSVVSAPVELDTPQTTLISVTSAQANFVKIPSTDDMLSEKLSVSNSCKNSVIQTVTDSPRVTSLSLVPSSYSNLLPPTFVVATTTKYLPVSVFDSPRSSFATIESHNLSQPINDCQEQSTPVPNLSPGKLSQDKENGSFQCKNTELVNCTDTSKSLTSCTGPLESTGILCNGENNKNEDESVPHDEQHTVSGNKLPSLEYLLTIENPFQNKKPSEETDVQEPVISHKICEYEHVSNMFTKTTSSTESPSVIFPTIVPCENSKSTEISTEIPLSTSTGILRPQVPALPKIHVPSITKIKELVGLTIKQPPAHQQQYLQLQQKILSKQIKTQLDIQRNILKRQNQFEQNSSLEENSLPPPKKPKNVFSDIVADVIQSIRELDKCKVKASSNVDSTQSSSFPLSSPTVTKLSNIQSGNDTLQEVLSELQVPELLPIPQASASTFAAPANNLPLNCKVDCPLTAHTGINKMRVSLLSQNSLSSERSSMEQTILPSQDLCTPAADSSISSGHTHSAKKLAVDILEQNSHPDPPVTNQVKDLGQAVKSIHPMPPLLKVSSDDCFMWPDISTQDEIVPLSVSLSESAQHTSTASTTNSSTSDPSLSLTTSVQPVLRQDLFPITVTSQTPQTLVTVHSSATTLSALSTVPSIPGFPSRVKVQVCSSNYVKTEGPTFSTQPQYRPVRPKPTASIGGVLVQSLEPNTSDHSPLPKVGSVFVSVLASSTPPVKNQETKSDYSPIGKCILCRIIPMKL